MTKNEYSTICDFKLQYLDKGGVFKFSRFMAIAERLVSNTFITLLTFYLKINSRICIKSCSQLINLSEL